VSDIYPNCYYRSTSTKVREEMLYVWVVEVFDRTVVLRGWYGNGKKIRMLATLFKQGYARVKPGEFVGRR
jgi:hypothetical protein